MKTRDDIDRRLEKLRSRYLRQHMSLSQSRRPANCHFNHEHFPTGPKPRTKSSPTDLAPRRSVTLVVLRDEPESIRLCMYGASDVQNWPGDICDRDDVARECRMFRARVSPEQAAEEFQDILRDDKKVLALHPDLASLQWVLDDRAHARRQPWYQRLATWFSSLFASTPLALPAPEPERPEDLWPGSEVETEDDR